MNGSSDIERYTYSQGKGSNGVVHQNSTRPICNMRPGLQINIEEEPQSSISIPLTPHCGKRFSSMIPSEEDLPLTKRRKIDLISFTDTTEGKKMLENSKNLPHVNRKSDTDKSYHSACLFRHGNYEHTSIFKTEAHVDNSVRHRGRNLRLTSKRIRGDTKHYSGFIKGNAEEVDMVLCKPCGMKLNSNDPKSLSARNRGKCRAIGTEDCKSGQECDQSRREALRSNCPSHESRCNRSDYDEDLSRQFEKINRIASTFKEHWIQLMKDKLSYTKYPCAMNEVLRDIDTVVHLCNSRLTSDRVQ